MTQTEKFIRVLESVKEGDRSRLCRLAGKPLDETLQAFDLFTGLWWPLREKSPRAPERGSAWLVAKLHSAFPVPHVRLEKAELARVLGRSERGLRNEFDRKRFRRRFDALLQSPYSGLEPHLRWALSIVRSGLGQKQIQGVDWVRLLDDLRLWVIGPDKQDEDPLRRKKDVRDVWAKHYLNPFVDMKGGNDHAD